jgi:hypothetical protein
MSIILLIIQTAIQILNQQMGGKQELVIGDALIDIIAKAKFAYQMQTGQPIDEKLIKPYEPI